MRLLSSLPKAYNVVVTALKASCDTVPGWRKVTERLLQEEKQLKETAEEEGSRAFRAKEGSRRGARKGDGQGFKKRITCFHCGKQGHIKRECREYLQSRDEQGKKKKALVVSGSALTCKSKEKWLVDSGATSHMCHDKSLFTDFSQRTDVTQVFLGDESVVKTGGQGSVELKTVLADGEVNSCTLSKVLWAPELSHNLLSIPASVKAGNTVQFSGNTCNFRNKEGETVAQATRSEDLYYLNYRKDAQERAFGAKGENLSRLWHRRLGHLNQRSMELMLKEGFVDHLGCSPRGEVGVCEPCIGGKQSSTSFEHSQTKTSKPLELVHSDVCGKMGKKSIGGAEYFLTLIDDFTHYTWIFPLKTKDQVFQKFKDW